MTAPSAVQNSSALPAVTGFALGDIVRRHLGLPADETVSLEEISQHTNLNHIYRAEIGARSIYVKVVPGCPKRLAITLPRERVFAEAEAIRIFKQHASSAVLVPDVLFVDREEFVLGMTDVGVGRKVLIDVFRANYALLVPQGKPLGWGLGLVHSGTAGMGQFRPPQHDQLLRSVVFQGLIAPGAKAAFPDLADGVLNEMSVRRECLVHADLWGKNILVGAGVVPAIVDFEGAFVGDGAFDVATVLATATLPVIDRSELLPDCARFTSKFLSSYRMAYRFDDVADQTIARAFLYTGTLIAARGFGPFAYAMSGESRKRLALLARDLTECPAASTAEYFARIARFHHANGQ